jgi:hypothetical protein
MEEMVKQLNIPDLTQEAVKLKINSIRSRCCADILLLNNHILQQRLPPQFHLPPFWNRLPRSRLWNCVNSIVQPLNSISLIQPR